MDNNNQIDDLTLVICEVILDIDRLVRSTHAITKEKEITPYTTLQVELARKLMSQVQAITWSVLETLDDYLKEIE